MKAARTSLLLTLLCGISLALPSLAQDAQESAPPALPDFASLEQDWWTYFEGAQEDVGPRIETFLGRVNNQISNLGAQNQEIAPAVLEAVRENLEVYLSLLSGFEIQRGAVPEPATQYSLDELLTIAAGARESQSAAVHWKRTLQKDGLFSCRVREKSSTSAVLVSCTVNTFVDPPEILRRIN